MIDELLAQGLITPLWKKDGIEVFKNIEPHHRIEIMSELPNILPTYYWGIYDAAYEHFGTYISNPDINVHATYPYRKLLNSKDRLNNSLNTFKHLLIQNDMYIDAATIYASNARSANVQLMTDSNGKKFVRITSDDVEKNGVLIDLPYLSQSTAYVVSINTKNVNGIPLRLCVFSFYSNLCHLYDETTRSETVVQDSFIVPPYVEAQGYSLRIDNVSFGSKPAVNDIYDIQVTPIPFDELNSMYYGTDKPLQQQITKVGFKGYFNNTLYAVETTTEQLGNQQNELILWRSYNKDWIAFSTNNLRVFSAHHPVNNWANGWTIELNDFKAGEPLRIIIVFWPQLLQYAGYVLLILALIVAIVMPKYRSKAS
ncbi:MAG: hypothetical protein UZ22_OP11002000376 [Microgenomates bacterium OLB23]|nr:MAG: hypothetical protein UZ22_OP11002000376 [Microgenomates bacterium OLB23]